MTPTSSLPLVTVRSEFGGDGSTVHQATRTAGQPFNGPTVYVTACGLYAHHRADTDAVTTCTACGAA